jgi:hypothetical protein
MKISALAVAVKGSGLALLVLLVLTHGMISAQTTHAVYQTGNEASIPQSGQMATTTEEAAFFPETPQMAHSSGIDGALPQAIFQHTHLIGQIPAKEADSPQATRNDHFPGKDTVSPQATRIVPLPAPAAVSPQATRIVYLSGRDAAMPVEWEFFCTDGRNSGRWTTIPVPSNWELQGFGTYNYGHDWRDKNLKLGQEEGLYRYRFDVPATWKGKTVKIVFDGSMTDTEVKINGRVAGPIHQGAFYRFRYDITPLLKFNRSNLLEVRVAKHSANESVNRAERQADFWIFGGIFRPVFLEILPGIHMSRTAIDARADGTFRTLIEHTPTPSDARVTVELFDLQGNSIGEPVREQLPEGAVSSVISGKFEHIKPWNPEWPTLYTMKITLLKGDEVLHEVKERIGFRTVELRKHDGFYVNGRKVVFKGVNRHSFWPETGRALSEEHLLTDIRLIKEMNMNAVRCSHYVPDRRFLELCDSLGLFVLDEVTGWQDAYDTLVGPKLVRETILKDENHPSVVIWNHGNEGGWDFANEKGFHEYDIQKRPVLYPWLLRNGADTHHYPAFDYAIGRYGNGNDPFMATELLHGLYDGGHGAGLEAYWRNYETSPLHAGGFLWALADEAILRTDMDSLVYDAVNNQAPDGILGPHREKEGSFYTIREIWSPVQVKPVTITRRWDGRLFLENKYIYTNLNACTFTWKAVKTGFNTPEETITGSGMIPGPDTGPGETSVVQIDAGEGSGGRIKLDEALAGADVFYLTATGPHGNELFTWSWPVVQPWEKAQEVLKSPGGEVTEVGQAGHSGGGEERSTRQESGIPSRNPENIRRRATNLISLETGEIISRETGDITSQQERDRATRDAGGITNGDAGDISVREEQDFIFRQKGDIDFRESAEAVTAAVAGLEITFAKTDGTLLAVKNKEGKVSLTGGPKPVGVPSKITGTKWGKDGEGNFTFEITTDHYPARMTWTLFRSGVLKLEASPLQRWASQIDYLGISFNYPEEKCTGVRWMGSGPYRVWKNRLKGSTFGVWEKAYNNTVTGESFNNLVYPEFKGYHGHLYWATLKNTESDFTVISGTPNLYFRLFTPAKPKHVSGGTHPPFPEGDLSFLVEIPAIGTKFKQPEALGPGSGKGHYTGHTGDQGYPMILWFLF